MATGVEGRVIAIVDQWAARLTNAPEGVLGGLENTRWFAQVGEPELAVENLCSMIYEWEIIPATDDEIAEIKSLARELGIADGLCRHLRDPHA